MLTQTIGIRTVEELVGSAIAAPSMHNAQPWLFRFVRGSGLLQLRRDPTRAMPVTDLGDRAQHLSCGAALFNLRVAAAHAGWEPQVSILPDPDEAALLAAITFRPSDTDGDHIAPLCPAVPRRRTSREPFTDEPVPEEIRDGLRGAAVAEGARLTFLGEWQVQSVLELTEEAAYRESVDAEVRAETARWVRAMTPGPATDGIPVSALGPRRYDGRAPVRDFTPHTRPRGQSAAAFERLPCLAVLSVPQDRPADWLNAGQAMERVLLQATLDGLATSLSSQALEWPELRWAVRDPFTAGSPQMLLRLGYGPAPAATLRRPVSEVLEIV